MPFILQMFLKLSPMPCMPGVTMYPMDLLLLVYTVVMVVVVMLFQPLLAIFSGLWFC